jgi:endonuclease/exonuclease/phosphatase family metal-dependent hydrolase
MLRVVSYNIHRAIGSDGRRDPARIAAVIAELQADVIGLQEVDWHHDHTDGESQFEYLAHLPGYEAIAGPNLRDHRGHYGNLLLTRVAVRRFRQLDLSEAKREPRGAIDVVLEIADKDLRIIVTHLGLGLRERRRQAARLREVLLDDPGPPALLLGDFNEWLPGNPTLRPLLPLCTAAAHPASYPSSFPVLALDRILAVGLPAAPVVSVYDAPLARRASDHLPVATKIEIEALPSRHSGLSVFAGPAELTTGTGVS